MQVSNLGEYLLVCHKTDVDQLLLLTPFSEPAYKNDKLYIFVVGAFVEELKKSLSRASDYNLNCYLDKFYIWTSKIDLRKRQEVLDNFFQLIANEYEKLIDVQRNKENIKQLLEILDYSLGGLRGNLIIDYGCGTGISVDLAKLFGVKLIGVDRCPKMRQIASGKGMKVWSPGDLARQPKQSIDGIFASYVFHLLPYSFSLRMLWSRLKPNGVMIANFHKKEGVDLVANWIDNLGGTTIYMKNYDRHGTYIAYRK